MLRRSSRALAAAGLAVAAVSTGAGAADLGSGSRGYGGYDYPTALGRPQYYGNWSGFYLGGALGYGWGEGRASGDIGAVPFDQSGTLGGVFAGYNWQLGSVVLGVEADVGTGDLGASQATPFGTLHSELNAFGSFRGRAGVLVGPALMIYGTAGLAWADMDFRLGGGAAQSETFLGYQVGLGGEYMISDHVGLRLEYIYTGLPEEAVTHSGLTNVYDPSFNTVRAGISMKF